MRKLIFILVAFFGFAALDAAAARAAVDRQRSACERDSHKFCAAEEPNAIAVEKCLRAHVGQLSKACKRQFMEKGR
ncbi:MAG: hypothetical protein FJX45_02045 [Alphaproteobacteria bacterium]|nr:hypothetical protein [Alphaproteobacteria bacterium]MBM3653036.1 hypothetical protein [Alphaproteobacteria bacterium]